MSIDMMVGILIIVIGIIVGVIVLAQISTSPLGDCKGIDWIGNGTSWNNDPSLRKHIEGMAGYKACTTSISSGFNIYQIAASLIIILIIPVIIGMLRFRGGM